MILRIADQIPHRGPVVVNVTGIPGIGKTEIGSFLFLTDQFGCSARTYIQAQMVIEKGILHTLVDVKQTTRILLIIDKIPEDDAAAIHQITQKILTAITFHPNLMCIVLSRSPIRWINREFRQLLAPPIQIGPFSIEEHYAMASEHIRSTTAFLMSGGIPGLGKYLADTPHSSGMDGLRLIVEWFNNQTGDTRLLDPEALGPLVYRLGVLHWLTAKLISAISHETTTPLNIMESRSLIQELRTLGLVEYVPAYDGHRWRGGFNDVLRILLRLAAPPDNPDELILQTVRVVSEHIRTVMSYAPNFVPVINLTFALSHVLEPTLVADQIDSLSDWLLRSSTLKTTGKEYLDALQLVFIQDQLWSASVDKSVTALLNTHIFNID